MEKVGAHDISHVEVFNISMYVARILKQPKWSQLKILHKAIKLWEEASSPLDQELFQLLLLV